MKHFLVGCLALALCLPLGGCVYAPGFNVLGSYFPAWMLCAFLGILFAVLVRFLVQRFHFEDYIRPALITYPCTAALFTFTLWLMLFS